MESLGLIYTLPALRLPGVQRSDALTGLMLLVVLAAFLRWTLAARNWSSRRLGLSPTVEEGSTEVKKALLDAAESSLVPHANKKWLPPGESDRIVDSLRAEHLRFAPPGWLALGNSVLISLGLVGTFLGLTVGLFKAVPLITQEEASKVKEGMDALLDGARLAFVKSLAGLLLALPWSLRYQELEVRWEKLLDGWRGWLNEQHPPLSQEHLLAELHLRQKIDHDELCRTIKTASSNAAAQLDSGLKREGDALRQHLSAQLKGLRKAVEEVQEAIGQLGENLPDQMGAAFLSQLGSRLEDIQRAIADFRKALSTDLAAHLRPSLDQLKGSIDALSGAGDIQIREAIEAGAGEAIRTLSQNLDNVSNKLEGLGTKLEEGADNAARRLEEGGMNVSLRLALTGGVLVGGAEKITSSASDLVTALTEAKTVAGELKGAGEAARDALQDIATPIREAADDFTNVAGTLHALPTQLEGARDALEEAAGALDVAAEGLRNERGAAEKLLSSTKELTVQVSGLHAEGERIAGLLRTGGEQLQRGLTELDRLAVRLTALSSTFEGVTGTMVDGIRKVAEEFRPIHAALRDVAQVIGSATGALQAAAQALQEERESFEGISNLLWTHGAEINLMISKATENLNEVVESLNQAHSSVTSAIPDLIDQLALASYDSARLWQQADDARKSALKQNAEELANYADKVAQATKIPAELNQLNTVCRLLLAELERIRQSVPSVESADAVPRGEE